MIEIIKKILEIFLNNNFLRRKRDLDDIRLLKEVLDGETDETLIEIHTESKREYSFRIKTGFKGDVDHHKFLNELNKKLGKKKWYLIRDAYKIWKVKNGELDLSVSGFQKKIASVLYITIFSLWGAAGVIGFFVAKWHLADTYVFYFFLIYALAIIGVVLMFVFTPYYAAITIDKMLKKQEIENAEQLNLAL